MLKLEILDLNVRFFLFFRYKSRFLDISDTLLSTRHYGIFFQKNNENGISN